MSENERQLQTNAVINDKLQRTVVTYLRGGGSSITKLKTFIVESVSEEKNKIGEYLAKLQASRWLSRALCVPDNHTTIRRTNVRHNPPFCP